MPPYEVTPKDVPTLCFYYNNNYVDVCTEQETDINHEDITALFLLDVGFVKHVALEIFLGHELTSADHSKLGIVAQRINDFYSYTKSLK